LLPDAIEKGKAGVGLNSPETFIGCQQGFNGPQVMTLIGNILNVMSFNSSGLHYIILDEVDNLTKLAQQSLKSAMNTRRAVFILTTNNISELDKGLKDRCVLIEMNAGAPEEYLPLAKEIAQNKNVVLNDEVLLEAISLANGSFRNLNHGLTIPHELLECAIYTQRLMPVCHNENPLRRTRFKQSIKRNVIHSFLAAM
jgi:replication-associated recombination protein RarA